MLSVLLITFDMCVTGALVENAHAIGEDRCAQVEAGIADATTGKDMVESVV